MRHQVTHQVCDCPTHVDIYASETFEVEARPIDCVDWVFVETGHLFELKQSGSTWYKWVLQVFRLSRMDKLIYDHSNFDSDRKGEVQRII